MRLKSIIAAVVVTIASASAFVPAAEARDRSVTMEQGPEIQLVRDHRGDRDDRRDYREGRRYDRDDSRYDRRQERRYDRNDRPRDRRPPWVDRDRRGERGNWKFQYR